MEELNNIVIGSDNKTHYFDKINDLIVNIENNKENNKKWKYIDVVVIRHIMNYVTIIFNLLLINHGTGIMIKPVIFHKNLRVISFMC